MSRRKRQLTARFLVLTWRLHHGENRWLLHRGTVVTSLGSAKRLRTVNQKYPWLRTSIIADQILDGIGEIAEPLKPRDWIAKHLDLDKLAIRTAKQ